MFLKKSKIWLKNLREN